MKVLYIDNFRGFEKTFLSLEEVNFFVGENSTGKTSLLKLIGIISSAGFWNYQQFNNSEIDLGTFSDIVSSNSQKEFFEIGILETTKDKALSAIKLKFIEQNNYPHIKEICLLNENLNIQCTIEGNFLKYRYEEVNFDSIKDKKKYFQGWVEKNTLQSMVFQRSEIEFIGIKSILFQLQSLISEKVKSLKTSIPPFLNDIAWFAPVRAQPVKTYDNYLFSFQSDGIHAPYVLKEILNDDNTGVRYILTRYGKDSGIFDDIHVNRLGDDPTKNDPFEILITLNNQTINIVNVGYGVSQILPLLIEIIARPLETWFAIQQPEIHLHPRAQAAFGDFMYKSNDSDGHKFIVETHSDYTIDRFRLRLNRGFQEDSTKNSQSRSQVVFFRRNERGNFLETININADGSYSDEQPEEFRGFFIREQLELITI